MEESADEVNKREELLKMYHSTKEALKIISKSNGYQCTFCNHY